MNKLNIKKLITAITIGVATLVTTPYFIYKDNTITTYATQNRYTLTAPTNRYYTSNDALNNINSVGVYEPGEYYIYKEFNGMINIARYPNGAGSWINPNGNSMDIDTDIEDNTDLNYTTTDTTTTHTVEQTIPTTTISTTTIPTTTYTHTSTTNTITISKTPKYITAQDAIDKVNSVGYYEGEYYIYKTWGKAINVTKNPNLPGAWICLSESESSESQYSESGLTKPTSTIATTTTTKATTSTTTKETTYQSIADLASKYIGYNHSTFTSWYGLTDEWCAIFVSYIANQTNNSAIIPKMAYVPSYVDTFKRKANIVADSAYRPEKDMLIVFDYEPNGIANHIGIVSGSDDKYVYTIEGNTGSYDMYSSVVQAKKYDINDSNILGYMLPAYGGTHNISNQLVSNGAYIKRLIK